MRGVRPLLRVTMSPHPHLLTACLSLVGMTLVAAAPPPAQGGRPSGTKIVVRQSLPNGNNGSDRTLTTTVYLQGDRKREETRIAPAAQLGPGAHTAVITRCDRGDSLLIDFGEREYIVTPLRSLLPAGQQVPLAAAPHPPTLIVETTSVDTSERRTMFGRQARHVITTERRIPHDRSISDNSESVTDGWYIDISTSLPCERGQSGGAVVTVLTVNKSADGLSTTPVVSFRDIGKRETGYVVASTNTVTFHDTSADGTTRQFVSTLHREVTQITEQPLDPALFEPPAGFLDVSPGSWGCYWKAGRRWLHDVLRRLIG